MNEQFGTNLSIVFIVPSSNHLLEEQFKANSLLCPMVLVPKHKTKSEKEIYYSDLISMHLQTTKSALLWITTNNKYEVAIVIGW